MEGGEFWRGASKDTVRAQTEPSHKWEAGPRNPAERLCYRSHMDGEEILTGVDE